jgi:3-oxoadipate enol-lactonase
MDAASAIGGMGPSKSVLILSNSIATDLRMWDPQIPELAKHFRILRYDFRGHGSSGIPAGAYSLDRLGRDVLELLDALQIERAHFCGLSLGGMVAQWLGIHAPDRINRLILSNTASYLGPAKRFDDQIASVMEDDASITADRFLHNWFPSQMLNDGEVIVQSIRSMVLAIDRRGLAGCLAAVRDADMRHTVALIRCPTLVIAGQYDTVTLPSHSESIAEAVSGARLITLPVVHLSNLENPETFLSAVLEFLLA